jgi:predicted aspartyl protease
MRFLTRFVLIAVFVLFSSGKFFAEKIPERTVFIINRTITITGTSFGNISPLGELESVVIPLKRIGRLFMIEAKVDNTTGNFLLDTGAAQLVLNSTYFRKYVSSLGGEGSGITGSTGTIRNVQIKNLDVAGLLYKDQMADVTDLGHIENRRGVKVLGLFGVSMLKGLEMVLDIRHNELRLYRLNKSGIRVSTVRDEFRADVTEKIELYHNVLFVKVKIGGKLLDFCLDTGAESNVLSSYAPKKVLSTITILRRSDLMGAGSGESEVLLANLNDFAINDHPIKGMQAIITSLEALSATYGYPIDGMLGYDFFDKGEISINLVLNELKINLNKTQ